ncbi:MAG: hypothetical protein RL759_1056 [Verrucomicrobiota bacterium]|jgi:hypothetical protein
MEIATHLRLDLPVFTRTGATVTSTFNRLA